MNIIIWGTGKIGKLAYFYYRESKTIKCFIDNDENKQGSFFEGIEICEPRVLKDCQNIMVVVASEKYGKNIQMQLYHEFGIRSSIIFEIQHDYMLYGETYDNYNHEILIRMSGGIGNQMFQYAFGKCFEKRGRKVTYELSYYNNIAERHFILKDVFTKTNMLFQKAGFVNPKLPIYYDQDVKAIKEYRADMKLLDSYAGYFIGYWQSWEYADIVREELLKEFIFPDEKEEMLRKVSRDIASENSVSIHIRRGDYLSEGNEKIFAGICTEEYYARAIEYISEVVENVEFYVFSNDIPWVKRKYNNKNMHIIDRGLFEDYQDWYDMYLMCCCKHNIIANSTFSWWGAWLNKNRGKIVVAPQKVVNTCNVLDFYPEEWIRV